MTHEARRQAGIPPLEYANLARAWLFVYGVLYFCAAILGMKVVGWATLLSLFFLVLSGILCWAALYLDFKLLRIGLSLFWGFACVANWMKVISWLPQYSDLQYTVMAVLNLVNALSLAYLGEVWKIE